MEKNTINITTFNLCLTNENEKAEQIKDIKEENEQEQEDQLSHQNSQIKKLKHSIFIPDKEKFTVEYIKSHNTGFKKFDTKNPIILFGIHLRSILKEKGTKYNFNVIYKKWKILDDEIKSYYIELAKEIKTKEATNKTESKSKMKKESKSPKHQEIEVNKKQKKAKMKKEKEKENDSFEYNYKRQVERKLVLDDFNKYIEAKNDEDRKRKQKIKIKKNKENKKNKKKEKRKNIQSLKPPIKKSLYSFLKEEMSSYENGFTIKREFKRSNSNHITSGSTFIKTQLSFEVENFNLKRKFYIDNTSSESE